MNANEMREVLCKHKAWLENEEGGERADLSDANLSDANLSDANLRNANLRNANLRNADLSDANLRNANLRNANLSYADLSDANLRNANLSYADLSDANLRNANLSYANLSDANLSDANLRGANLSGVYYNEATAFYAMACPERGSFIGFKKAHGLIVELLIPEDAKRSSATTRKCRCDKAQVISITNPDGSDAGCMAISSDHDNGFVYTVGEMAEVEDFDEDRWRECAPGIHFFITRDEAVRYQR